MNSTDKDDLEFMLGSFRLKNLLTLLGAFHCNKAGSKAELKEKAIELLRTRPPVFNYWAYTAKIVDIYIASQTDGPNNNDMIQNKP